MANHTPYAQRRGPQYEPRFDREEIRRLYTYFDHDANLVAHEMGCTTKTVHRVTLDMRRTPPQPNRADPEKLARAKELLDDRSGYREASRSTGIDHKTLVRHFPGMGLTQEEIFERSSMVHKLNRIGGLT